MIKNLQASSRQNRQSKIIAVRNVLQSSGASGGKELQESRTLMQSERQEILRDAHAEAEKLMESARIKAERIEDEVSSQRLKWEQEKEMLQQEAYQQAYQHGLEEGRANGLEEYREQISQAVQAVSFAKENYYKQIEKAESVILELGMKTAEKILGTNLDGDPNVFLGLIKRAIKEVKEYPEVQVHVHPSHYTMLCENQEELEAMFPVLRQLLIFPDDELGREECFIETGEGRVIVSVDVQLKEIKNKLIEILEGGEE
ncbi:flagellar assembly protein FliH [Bacillus salacetis]|uniref:flagellar assembly protein FliH n=1 Tax=Bacillus salacetis TaxID=2315464 RepID=UPI001F0C2F46|nr:flagellar assembly protein FliH [Bacillus salacetis]